MKIVNKKLYYIICPFLSIIILLLMSFYSIGHEIHPFKDADKDGSNNIQEVFSGTDFLNQNEDIYFSWAQGHVTKEYVRFKLKKALKNSFFYYQYTKSKLNFYLNYRKKLFLSAYMNLKYLKHIYDLYNLDKICDLHNLDKICDYQKYLASIILPAVLDNINIPSKFYRFISQTPELRDIDLSDSIFEIFNNINKFQIDIFDYFFLRTLNFICPEKFCADFYRLLKYKKKSSFPLFFKEMKFTKEDYEKLIKDFKKLSN
jgi:hypothetical protein